MPPYPEIPSHELEAARRYFLRLIPTQVRSTCKKTSVRAACCNRALSSGLLASYLGDFLNCKGWDLGLSPSRMFLVLSRIFILSVIRSIPSMPRTPSLLLFLCNIIVVVSNNEGRLMQTILQPNFLSTASPLTCSRLR